MCWLEVHLKACGCSYSTLKFIVNWNIWHSSPQTNRHVFYINNGFLFSGILSAEIQRLWQMYNNDELQITMGIARWAYMCVQEYKVVIVWANWNSFHLIVWKSFNTDRLLVSVLYSFLPKNGETVIAYKGAGSTQEHFLLLLRENLCRWWHGGL